MDRSIAPFVFVTPRCGRAGGQERSAQASPVVQPFARIREQRRGGEHYCTCREARTACFAPVAVEALRGHRVVPYIAEVPHLLGRVSKLDTSTISSRTMTRLWKALSLLDKIKIPTPLFSPFDIKHLLRCGGIELGIPDQGVWYPLRLTDTARACVLSECLSFLRGNI